VLVQAIGPIPNDTLVAGPSLPATTRAALTRWLLALPAETKPLFEALFDTSEFRPAETSHYDALRHVVRAARARGYDALPRASRSAFRVR
jgi:ABC-type phosphate/phosphonate transport system substrate-binding protein